jgi:hypothetical protein
MNQLGKWQGIYIKYIMIDMHPNITKNFEETLKSSYIESKILDFNLPSTVNCRKRQSNWMGWPL